MHFSELIQSGQKTRDDDTGLSFQVTEDWMQGRTTYGGLTAAFCLQSALPLAGNRPLRSAQIAFVGPVSGTVTCEAELLREGKNTVFANVRMYGTDGLAADAIFAFGKTRSSILDFSRLSAPAVTAPDETPSLFEERSARPGFTQNFNMRLALGGRILSGSAEADISLWLRHKDIAVSIDPVSLLALADAPPPAAMSRLTAPTQVSSMTWMAEFLTDEIHTENGWFLARHTADTARQGYSSQSMTMWNTSGEPIMIGRQTIAVFG